MQRLRTIHPLTALAVLAAVVVFLKNAWVSEDAYIIFRSLEQLFAGHGPVWNPHERVQAFTSPLWFGLLAAVRIFSTDVFLNAIGLGLTLWLACLAVIRRAVLTPGAFLLVVLALLAANGLMDYTSSGLENSLLYLLLALFVLFFGRTLEPRSDIAELSRLWLVAGLVLLTRLDQVFLLAPALVGATWRARAQLGRRDAACLLARGVGPLLAWTAFSFVYYGFPLPNTAYAKLNTGIDTFVLVRQGLKYFLTSLGLDTITLVAVGAFAWWGRKVTGVRLLAAGIVLQLAYTVWVGGDFMQGRFLSGPYLVAVVAAVALTGWRLNTRPAVWVGLIVYTVFYPHTPVNVPPEYPVPEITLGVADERGIYNDALSLWQYVKCRHEGRTFPDMSWRRDAEVFRADDRPVLEVGNIGVFGYFAGTDKIIIDSLALSDPLLARLPVAGSWRVGHYRRNIPAGYVDGLASKKTGGLEDVHLRKLHDDLILITRSTELFTAARWRAILRQNF